MTSQGSRRELVLVLAAFTMVIEVAVLAGLVPMITIGGLRLSASLVPALVLGIACGARLLGRSSLRYSAAGFWAAVGLLLLALCAMLAEQGRLTLVPTLLLAALNEELVYRLAIPAVVAAGLGATGVGARSARIGGLVVGAAWFCLLPGHTQQVSSLTGLVPYIGFAALTAIIVYRSGSILPVAVVHGAANIFTYLMWEQAVPPDERSIAIAGVLSLLVIVYGRTSRVTIGDNGGLIDVYTGQPVLPNGYVLAGQPNMAGFVSR